MYRIQVYVGKGQGWRWGTQTYNMDQLTIRCLRLDEVGIKYRIGNENEMFID